MCWHCEFDELLQKPVPDLDDLKAFKGLLAFESLNSLLLHAYVGQILDHTLHGWHQDMVAGEVLDRLGPSLGYTEPSEQEREAWGQKLSVLLDPDLCRIVMSPEKGPMWKWCVALNEHRRRIRLQRLAEAGTHLHIDF